MLTDRCDQAHSICTYMYTHGDKPIHAAYNEYAINFVTSFKKKLSSMHVAVAILFKEKSVFAMYA